MESNAGFVRVLRADPAAAASVEKVSPGVSSKYPFKARATGHYEAWGKEHSDVGWRFWTAANSVASKGQDASRSRHCAPF